MGVGFIFAQEKKTMNLRQIATAVILLVVGIYDVLLECCVFMRKGYMVASPWVNGPVRPMQICWTSRWRATEKIFAIGQKDILSRPHLGRTPDRLNAGESVSQDDVSPQVKEE